MDEEMKRKWFDKSIPMYPEPPSATTSKSASSMSGSSTKRGHTFHDNFLADSTKVFDLTEDELDLMSMEKKARTDEHAQRLEEGQQRMAREQENHDMQMRKDELSLKEREAALQAAVVDQALLKLLTDKGIL
jgi:hypothetical protein